MVSEARTGPREMTSGQDESNGDEDCYQATFVNGVITWLIYALGKWWGKSSNQEKE